MCLPGVARDLPSFIMEPQCTEITDLLCRTCLCFVDEEDCINIIQDTQLINMYKECTSLQIDACDEYPKNMCESCYQQLQILTDFKQMCKDTLVRFKDFSNSNEAEFLRKETMLQMEKFLHNNNKQFNENDNSESGVQDSVKNNSDVNQEKSIQYSEENDNESACLTNNDIVENTVEQAELNETSLEVSTETCENIVRTDLVEYSEPLKYIKEVPRETLVEKKIVYVACNFTEIEEQDRNKLASVTNVAPGKDLCANVENSKCANVEYSKSNQINEEVRTNARLPIRDENFVENVQRVDKNDFSGIEQILKRSRKEVNADLENALGKSDISDTPGSKSTVNVYEQETSDARILRSHTQEQHSESCMPYACTFDGCTHVFSLLKSLLRHIDEYHSQGEPKRIHMCEICGKKFSRRVFLCRHNMVHLDRSQLPFECNECGKRFGKKLNLQYHLNRHAGIKNFVCTFCGIRKTTRAELATHLNYHTLDKTWTCATCGKVFNSIGNLRMHKNTVHEGIRNYECRYCHRRFGKAGTLKYHEMRHTGERPHLCKLCGQGFIQAVALRTHMKKHSLKD